MITEKDIDGCNHLIGYKVSTDYHDGMRHTLIYLTSLMNYPKSYLYLPKCGYGSNLEHFKHCPYCGEELTKTIEAFKFKFPKE